MGHGYEQGRLDLPFVGFCTFAKRPICMDWDNIDADVAILGIPYDMGTQYRSGARFGPRAIREASTLFSFGRMRFAPTDVKLTPSFLNMPGR